MGLPSGGGALKPQWGCVFVVGVATLSVSERRRIVKVRFVILATLVALLWVAPAHAYLKFKPSCVSTECRLVAQSRNLLLAKYVCEHGGGHHKIWSCRAVSWLSKQIERSRTALAPNWIAIQIHYATLIAESSGGDPWPNCRDPYDGSGASWQDTVNCENGGSWYDSPGYYRCGLQFDPQWEIKYGQRFCP